MKLLFQKTWANKKARAGLIISCLLIGVLLIYALFIPRQARSIEAAEHAYIPSLLLSGEVVAVHNGEISSRVTAAISELKVRKGERVNQGELLAVLDSRQAEAEIAQARASLEYSLNYLSRQEQSLSQEQSGVELDRQKAEKRIEKAALNLESARLELEQGQADYERSVAVYQAGAISLQEFEQAGIILKNQESAVALAEKEEELARLELAAIQDSTSDIAMRQSEVGQKQASLQASEAHLDDYYLYAPIDGQVTDIFKLEGDTLTAGETLLNLSSTTQTRILIKPDQRYAQMIAPGTRAEVWSQASPDEHFGGRIVYVKPDWDAQEGTLEAEIELDSPDPSFSMGAILTVQLLSLQEEKALIIPQSYLSSLTGKAGVWVYKSNQAVFVPITTAEGNANGVIVKSGIQAGDILLFPDSLSEGERLRLVPDDQYQPSS